MQLPRGYHRRTGFAEASGGTRTSRSGPRCRFARHHRCPPQTLPAVRADPVRMHSSRRPPCSSSRPLLPSRVILPGPAVERILGATTREEIITSNALNALGVCRPRPRLWYQHLARRPPRPARAQLSDLSGVAPPAPPRRRTAGARKPRPRIEAFFTTDLGLCLEAILAQYRARWAVEITLRDSYAFDGVGQDQSARPTGLLARTPYASSWPRPHAVVSRAHPPYGALSLAMLSPLVPPEGDAESTRHCLDVPRSPACRGSFSHTSLWPRSGRKSRRARAASPPCSIGRETND